MTDRASAEGLREALRDLLNYESVHPLTGGNKTRLEAVRAALRSSESDSGLDDYHRGYADGESSCMADWIAALQDVGGWPDDVEVTPTAVALRLSTPRTETSEPAATPDRADPSPDLQADDLWIAAKIAADRGETVGKYHHRAVLDALLKAEMRGRLATPDRADE